MSKSLSMDLRERLISAVENGMPRRSAAIKWVDQKRRTGSVRPCSRGGDHHSHRLEGHADEFVSLAKNSDITLAELADQVLQTHGLTVAPSTIWRLLDRHDMTFKKPLMPPNSNGPTFFAVGRPGSPPRSILSPSGWCSSMARR